MSGTRLRLKSELKRPAALSDAEIALWRRWQGERPELASPFLTPDFALAVGAARRDAWVAVLRRGEEPAGFLALQGVRDKRLRPIGAPLNDVQGLVAPPGGDLAMDAMVRALPVGAFVYTGWRTEAPGASLDHAYISDLSGGAEAFFAAQRAQHKDAFKQTARRQRRLEEEVGAAELIWPDRAPDTFDRLVAWKRRKYQTTGKHDVLAVGWVRALLRAMWESRDPFFAAEIATLRAGGRVVAMEYGLRAGRRFHSWFPAFDADFSRYSPGILLMEAMYHAAAARGIDVFDMGIGHGHYKAPYANRMEVRASGVVLNDPIRVSVDWTLGALSAPLRVLPARAVADLPGKLRRRWEIINAIETSAADRVRALVAAARGPIRNA